MANSVSLGSAKRERTQFQGLFKDMWVVSVDATFDTDVAADGGEEHTFTVDGVTVNDGVIFCAPVGGDPEPNDFTYTAHVTAANTVAIAVKNAGAVNTPLVTGFKIVVARPNW